MIAVATEHVECPAYLEDKEESADHFRRCEWDHQTWQVRRTDHHALLLCKFCFAQGFFFLFCLSFFFLQTNIVKNFSITFYNSFSRMQPILVSLSWRLIKVLVLEELWKNLCCLASLLLPVVFFLEIIARWCMAGGGDYIGDLL